MRLCSDIMPDVAIYYPCTIWYCIVVHLLLHEPDVVICCYMLSLVYDNSYLYRYTHIYARISVYTCIYIYMCIHMYVYIYIHVFLYSFVLLQLDVSETLFRYNLL